MTGWLAAYARPAVTQPLSRPVPADDLAYRQRKGALKLAFRLMRRRMQFTMSQQAASLHKVIDPAWRRALWIHTEAPQIGDALMDLAPRSLLTAHGIRVELCAAPHLVELFRDDPWFERAFSDPAEIEPMRHDFIIVASHARRALDAKCRSAPWLPWISLAGEYSVPDYQRGMFNARRLADALGVSPDDATMHAHARQKLGEVRALPEALTLDDLSRPRVALALGGVRAERTYSHWADVLTRLHACGVRSVVLTGSSNATEARDALLAVALPGLRILDAVARTDLAGTRSLFAGCSLVVAADGGLMHLALTTRVPVVALFGSAIRPEWRLPMELNGVGLRSACGEVDGIPAQQVADAVCGALC